jgi:3-oxoacyl-[acyl-carrier protein] reductase
LCIAFAGPDTTVCFTYRSNRAEAEQTASAISRAGAAPKAVCADVMDSGAVSDFFQSVLSASGRVDVLVNNAGITRDSLIPRMKEADWDDVVATSLKGAFNCTKAAARPMIKQKQGRIINITSIAGVAGNPGQANYSAAKAGLIGLTKAAARELASRGITVNAIAPGFIETDMTADLSESVKADILSRIPAGRTGRPADVAGLALFLASDEAAYITGQVIHVNGGLYT